MATPAGKASQGGGSEGQASTGPVPVTTGVPAYQGPRAGLLHASPGTGCGSESLLTAKRRGTGERADRQWAQEEGQVPGNPGAGTESSTSHLLHEKNLGRGRRWPGSCGETSGFPPAAAESGARRAARPQPFLRRGPRRAPWPGPRRAPCTPGETEGVPGPPCPAPPPQHHVPQHPSLPQGRTNTGPGGQGAWPCLADPSRPRSRWGRTRRGQRGRRAASGADTLELAAGIRADRGAPGAEAHGRRGDTGHSPQNLSGLPGPAAPMESAEAGAGCQACHPLGHGPSSRQEGARTSRAGRPRPWGGSTLSHSFERSSLLRGRRRARSHTSCAGGSPRARVHPSPPPRGPGSRTRAPGSLSGQGRRLGQHRDSTRVCVDAAPGEGAASRLGNPVPGKVLTSCPEMPPPRGHCLPGGRAGAGPGQSLLPGPGP